MENFRGKLNTTEYKIGKLLGNFIILDIVLLITVGTIGVGWRLLSWLIPQIAGGC